MTKKCECGRPLQGYANGLEYCPRCAFVRGEMCSSCGCDAGNGAGGYSNCCGADLIGPPGSRVPKEVELTIDLGTCFGRHPLPVEIYLFHPNKGDTLSEHSGVAVDVATAPEKTAERVFEFITDNPTVTHVNLYYTGLTEITVMTIRELEKRNVVVTPYRYNRESGEYEPY